MNRNQFNPPHRDNTIYIYTHNLYSTPFNSSESSKYCKQFKKCVKFPKYHNVIYMNVDSLIMQKIVEKNGFVIQKPF